MFGALVASCLRLLVALVILCGASLHAQPRALGEYDVKALFIFNLVQFVEWPASAFPQPDSPLYIGVLGTDPFGDALVTATKGEKVGGRPLVVINGRTLEELRQCQLVFVSRSESARIDAILAAYAGRPVLTVGDMPNFASRGGVLNFYRDGGKVRFDLNRAAAKAADLKVSAQLVRLAKLVGPQGEP